MVTPEQWERYFMARGADDVPLPVFFEIKSETSLLREEVACLRLLRAIAEQERDDAKADAEALSAECRSLRLRVNEDRALICAARSLDREQEAQIEALRSALTAAHNELAEQRNRIDVYQCEIAGLTASDDRPAFLDQRLMP